MGEVNRLNSFLGVIYDVGVKKEAGIKKRGLSFSLSLVSGCGRRMNSLARYSLDHSQFPSSQFTLFSYITWWGQRHLSLDTAWIITASLHQGPADLCPMPLSLHSSGIPKRLWTQGSTTECFNIPLLLRMLSMNSSEKSPAISAWNVRSYSQVQLKNYADLPDFLVVHLQFFSHPIRPAWYKAPVYIRSSDLHLTGHNITLLPDLETVRLIASKYSYPSKQRYPVWA